MAAVAVLWGIFYNICDRKVYLHVTRGSANLRESRMTKIYPVEVSRSKVSGCRRNLSYLAVLNERPCESHVARETFRELCEFREAVLNIRFEFFIAFGNFF